jgi:hypothetical protein
MRFAARDAARPLRLDLISQDFGAEAQAARRSFPLAQTLALDTFSARGGPLEGANNVHGI